MAYVADVDVHNFRSLTKAQLTFSPGMNLLFGDNGAGKSSLLEAVSIVSRGGGSVPHLREVLGPDGDRWRVTATSREIGRVSARIQQVVFSEGKKTQTIDDRPVSNRELALALPLVSLTPLNQTVVNEGASARLRWLDWCMFHVEHDFMEAWQNYRRTLKQRNAALRMGVDRSSMEGWSKLLVTHGDALAALRKKWFPDFSRQFTDELSAFLPDSEWVADFYPGWEGGKSLREALKQSLAGDLRMGSTRYGPHRADWNARRNGETVKRKISRGEEKLCAIALLLAVAKIVRDVVGHLPVLLLDDIEAEFASNTRKKVVDRLDSLGAQCIMTAHERLLELEGKTGVRMFHVEHGCVGSL